MNDVTPRWRLNCLGLFLFAVLVAACSNAQPAATLAPTFSAELAQGKQLFSQHCGSCHAVEPDTVIVGPSLFAISERALQRAPELTPEQYVEQSILQPSEFLVLGYDDLMPSNFGRRLSGEELDAIVAYILTLH